MLLELVRAYMNQREADNASGQQYERPLYDSGCFLELQEDGISSPMLSQLPLSLS
jgi:hypothetical protein